MVLPNGPSQIGEGFGVIIRALSSSFEQHFAENVP